MRWDMGRSVVRNQGFNSSGDLFLGEHLDGTDDDGAEAGDSHRKEREADDGIADGVLTENGGGAVSAEPERLRAPRLPGAEWALPLQSSFGAGLLGQ